MGKISTDSCFNTIYIQQKENMHHGGRKCYIHSKYLKVRAANRYSVIKLTQTEEISTDSCVMLAERKYVLLKQKAPHS